MQLKHAKMGWISDLLNLDEGSLDDIAHDKLEELIEILKSLAMEIAPLHEMDEILEQKKQGRAIRPEDRQRLLRILDQIKTRVAHGLKAEEEIKQVERRKLNYEKREEIKAAEDSESLKHLAEAWRRVSIRIFERLPFAPKIVARGIEEELFYPMITDESLLYEARKRIGLYTLKAFSDQYGGYYAPHSNLDQQFLDEGNLRELCQGLLTQNIPDEVKGRIMRLLNLPYNRQYTLVVYIGTVARSKELTSEQQIKLLNPIKKII